eukprot:Colp12_sorted_trinity150504_noHs@27662
MNAEKLARLQAQSRIGGKGTPRRKKKVVHKTAGGDDKKIQGTLKKLGVNAIPGIEEVNMFREDGKILHFTAPKVQAAIAANTFVVNGAAETKDIGDLLPTVLSQLGPENIGQLRKILGGLGAGAPAADDSKDDDVPELVENFDEAAAK